VDFCGSSDQCEPLFKCEGGDHAKEKSESPEIKYDVSLLATYYVAEMF